MYPLSVTYMTHIDYNALFTLLITMTCVVQWIECRTPDLGVDGSNHCDSRFFFSFIAKFPKYFQTFIHILAKVYLTNHINLCISAFDLLLRTYSKWLYNDQLRCYLLYIYTYIYSSFPHKSFSKFDEIDSGEVDAISIDIEPLLLRRPTVIFHVNPMSIFSLA